MYIRKYKPSDCECLAELFYKTVHSVNAMEYTEKQLNVQATGSVDLKKWNKSFLEHYTIVAISNRQIIGFVDIDKSGYLDRLYVHRDFQKQGIASAICDELENSVKEKHITTYASITVKPFFQSRGYFVVCKQEVIRQGISITNYVMMK